MVFTELGPLVYDATPFSYSFILDPKYDQVCAALCKYYLEIKPPEHTINRSTPPCGKFGKEVSTTGFYWRFKSSGMWCRAIGGPVSTVHLSTSFRKQHEQGQRTNVQVGATLSTRSSFKPAQRPARSITLVLSEKFPKWLRINTIDNVDKWLPYKVGGLLTPCFRFLVILKLW